MKYILFFMALVRMVNCNADVLYPISLDRIVNDSDVILYGVSNSQINKKNEFMFVDYDGKKKELDVFVTRFDVIRYYKGNIGDKVDVCIPDILGYDKFEVNKKYIVFLLKTKKSYVPIYGITGVVDVNEQEIRHFFYSNESYFENFSLLENKIISLVNKEQMPRKITKPYQRYERVINNPCW